MTPQLRTARLTGGGAAIMDIRAGRGRWWHLNGTAAHLWHQLAAGTPLDEAVDEFANHFAAQGADRDIVRADLTALARQLSGTGLLTARAAPAPDLTVTQTRIALPTNTPLSAADRVAGLLGMTAALVLLRCAPIRTGIAVAHALAHIPRRPATARQADALLLAVRRAGRAWPGRVACREESLGCHFAAVLRGRRVAWVIGARTAPAAAHAWNEADGVVIGQDAGDRVWPYAPALRI
ncbi:lasso peptide biosynthesis B2 protein [Streptomyces sp. MS19]|uniref:lasso peptide biosynthesis B2 protein n=1 Tax=Streptomyces sp. MS19 TaxID=3385972 RepID=UPI0039A28FE6